MQLEGTGTNLVLRKVVLLTRLGTRVERGEHVGELSISKRDGLVEILVLDGDSDGLSLLTTKEKEDDGQWKSSREGGEGKRRKGRSTHKLDGLSERVPDDLVLNDTDNVTGSLGLSLEDGVDGLDSLEGSEDSVESARSSSSLGVSEGGDSSVESELVGENVLDVLGLDGLELSVESSLGDDDDGFTLSELSVL